MLIFGLLIGLSPVLNNFRVFILFIDFVNKIMDSMLSYFLNNCLCDSVISGV